MLPIRLTIYQNLSKFKFKGKTYNNIWSILFCHIFNSPWQLQTILHHYLKTYPGQIRYALFPCFGISTLEKFKTRYNIRWQKINLMGMNDKCTITNEPISNKVKFFKTFKFKNKKFTLELTKEFYLY